MSFTERSPLPLFTGTPSTSTFTFLPSMPRMFILLSLPMPPAWRTFTPEERFVASAMVALEPCSSLVSITLTDSALVFLSTGAASLIPSPSIPISSRTVTSICESFAFLFCTSVAVLVVVLDDPSSKKSSKFVTSSSVCAKTDAADIKTVNTK